MGDTALCGGEPTRTRVVGRGAFVRPGATASKPMAVPCGLLKVYTLNFKPETRNPKP